MSTSEVCSNINLYIQVVIHLRIADLSFLEINWLEVEKGLSLVLYFHLTIYLAIVGGKTRFRPGISSRAQRGWFVSWAVIGILYGSVFSFSAMGGKLRSAQWLIALAFMFGAATVGGVVAMVQQYLQFVEC